MVQQFFTRHCFQIPGCLHFKQEICREYSSCGVTYSIAQIISDDVLCRFGPVFYIRESLRVNIIIYVMSGRFHQLSVIFVEHSPNTFLNIDQSFSRFVLIKSSASSSSCTLFFVAYIVDGLLIISNLLIGN